MIFIVLAMASSVRAEAIYLAQIKDAQWSYLELQEAVEKIEEHKPIKLADPLKIAPFHNQTVAHTGQGREFCISCHTALPHTKSERLRSYLNMHVNYLACTSCHYQPEGVVLDYRWHYFAEANNLEDAQKIITPFQQRNIVMLTNDHPDIARLLESWEKSDVRRKAEDHLRFHLPLLSEGVDCQRCHTTKTPLLDYRQLGYDNEAIKTLRENRIARFLTDDSFKEKSIKLMDLLQ
jgi:RNase P subunit RPR2